MRLRRHLFLAWILSASSMLVAQSSNTVRWTTARAESWYTKQPWIVGCNFIPSTAINQLEMWQKETFDPATIDREIRWAHDIGFNTVRVFLHVIPWQTDSAGFFSRIDAYLTIAAKHNIRTMFVLFDDCWNEDPKPGTQPVPKPGIHNSGWMQCPGTRLLNDSTTYPTLIAYTKSVLSHYAKDPRIILWDLYNEPGNSGHGLRTLPLLKEIVQAARSTEPSQPLSMGLWSWDSDVFRTLNAFQAENSDILTFHSYSDSTSTSELMTSLRSHGRPMICTEYMARTRNSRFVTHLPLFKQANVGALNWGFVSGKTNTIFPWGSKEGTPEPKIWFHDIFRADGTPFAPEEIGLIQATAVPSSTKSK